MNTRPPSAVTSPGGPGSGRHGLGAAEHPKGRSEKGHWLPNEEAKRERAARARKLATTVQKPTMRSRVTNGTRILTGIDHRSPTARRYRDLVAVVAADMGGVDNCSEARLQLIRRFAALSVQAEAMEAQLANGTAIDIVEYSQLTSTLVRVVSRLGINRTARNVTPHLHDYLEERASEVEP
jgi:hypothetical protein